MLLQKFAVDDAHDFDHNMQTIM